MAEKNKNGGEKDSINLLLEQALMRQRDKMIENFAHFIQRLSIVTDTSSSSSHLEEPLPSRYKLILIFPYLKVR